MASRQISKAEWRGYCETLTRALIGKQAEIEVAALSIGDQIEAEWLPMLGIAYDQKNNLIEIAVGGIDHLIHEPREFYIEEGPTGVSSIEIIDSEGERQIVKLRDPLALPSPSGAR
jgi:hypothetical protein